MKSSFHLFLMGLALTSAFTLVSAQAAPNEINQNIIVPKLKGAPTDESASCFAPGRIGKCGKKISSSNTGVVKNTNTTYKGLPPSKADANVLPSDTKSQATTNVQAPAPSDAAVNLDPALSGAVIRTPASGGSETVLPTDSMIRPSSNVRSLAPTTISY